MKTGVIYARYSSERQTEQSIEGQLRECNLYAEQNDIVIVDTYIDRAMTGTNDRRNEFQRMLADSAKHPWDIVLVYKLDRFGRNKYEMAINKHTLASNGVRLVSAKENIPDSPEGIILESLLEGMAEYYSAELSQKVKRGMNETRLKGNYTGGYIPYGFKKDGKKIVEDEEESKIVRWIYEEYAKGVYVKDIIAKLVEQGLTLRGRPFAKNTIHRILQSEKYSGIYTLRDTVYTNLYPKIVPDELFTIVQRKNKQNQHGDHDQMVKYLLRKKLYCGYCGRAINGKSGTSKLGKKKHYYCCSGNYSKKGCKKQNVSKEALEDIIIQAIMQAFEETGSISKLAHQIYELNRERLEDHTVMNLLLKQQRELQKSIDNLLAAIEQGVVTKSTKHRLDELDEKNDALQEKIEIEKTRHRVTISQQDVERFLKEALNNKSELLLDILVKKVILYDDKIEIICNFTKRQGPDSESLALLFYQREATLQRYAQETGAIVSMPVTVQLYF